MTALITTMLPAVLTVLGNIIFYIWFKARIDNSIEKHKVAFSGIYKERLELYKELLKQIYDLKRQINQYRHSGTEEAAELIMVRTILYYK